MNFITDKPTPTSRNPASGFKSIKQPEVTIKKLSQQKESTSGNKVFTAREADLVVSSVQTSSQNSASDNLLNRVSAEIEESIQKVIVTLADQDEMVVVIDGTSGDQINDISSFVVEETPDKTSEQLDSHQTPDATESIACSSESQKKKGRKPTINDNYKFIEESHQYICKRCGKTYKSKQSMNIHVAQCGKNLTMGETHHLGKKKGDKSHRQKVHHPLPEEEVSRSFTFDSAKEMWTCKECGKSYKTVPSVKSHKMKCRQQLKTCLYCDYEGRNSTTVRLHMMHKHNVTPRLNSDGQWIY